MLLFDNNCEQREGERLIKWDFHNISVIHDIKSSPREKPWKLIISCDHSWSNKCLSITERVGMVRKKTIPVIRLLKIWQNHTRRKILACLYFTFISWEMNMPAAIPKPPWARSVNFINLEIVAIILEFSDISKSFQRGCITDDLRLERKRTSPTPGGEMEQQAHSFEFRKLNINGFWRNAENSLTLSQIKARTLFEWPFSQ